VAAISPPRGILNPVRGIQPLAELVLAESAVSRSAAPRCPSRREFWTRTSLRCPARELVAQRELVTDGADVRVSLGAPSAAEHNRPLPSPNFRHRAEGEDAPLPREETATADDKLVRVVNVPLVADVIQTCVPSLA
jgi:hypothetical protein